MAPRASWKGFLRISLVTCPIALYPATSSSERISFNRINRATGQRVRQQNVDGKTGEKVEPHDIAKGYEVDKGRYVLIEDEDLDKIQVEASKIINVGQFVDMAEVDPFFFDTPYYMAPDGAISEETYRVVRTAMEETGTAGLGTLVLSSRERRVLLSPKGRGIALTTLRTSREVRGAESYFEGIGDGPVEADLLDMAKMLIGARKQPFQPAELVDQYEEAVRKLVMAKAQGQVPEFAPVSAPSGVVDLMKALKESLEKEAPRPANPLLAASALRPEPVAAAASRRQVRGSSQARSSKSRLPARQRSRGARRPPERPMRVFAHGRLHRFPSRTWEGCWLVRAANVSGAAAMQTTLYSASGPRHGAGAAKGDLQEAGERGQAVLSERTFLRRLNCFLCCRMKPEPFPWRTSPPGPG
jgi:DNA end-binding protein Ku